MTYSFLLKEIQGKGFADIQKVINNRLKIMENWQTPLKQISIVLYSAVLKNFSTEGARTPRGKWQPLAPSTLKRYARDGETSPRILQHKGILRGSLMPYAKEDEAGVYAAGAQITKIGIAHNFGALTGRGHHTKLPQREFMVLTDNKIIVQIGNDWIGAKKSA